MTLTSDLALEDDTVLAVLPRRVKVAAAVVFLAGTFGVLLVTQVYELFDPPEGPIAVAPYVMGSFALLNLVSGVGLFRARSWAPAVAATSSGLLWVVSAAWFVLELAFSVVTLFGIVVPSLALAALICSLRCRMACLATARARQRLADQGLDLGV